jgi:hypothetical protein
MSSATPADPIVHQSTANTAYSKHAPDPNSLAYPDSLLKSFAAEPGVDKAGDITAAENSQ